MEQEGQSAPQQLETPEFSPRPQQMMGFMDALTTVFRNKYATFSGRASRSEYWWSYLGIAVISMVLQIIGIVGGLALGSVNEGLGALFGLAAFAGLLALLIPSLSVNVRRLHDTGKSGWMLLILLIPCIGFILWLVWMIEDGQPHVNAYGAVPTNSLD
jgi:uncharacterized membrane protein YhaH (DUF805 family)